MISEILNSYAMSLDFCRSLLTGVSDDQMVCQPGDRMNHPAWTIGHLVVSCQMIGGELGLKPWLSDRWFELFKSGSKPIADSSIYPKKAELLDGLNDGQQSLVSKLTKMSDEDMAGPLPDERYRQMFPTLGHAVLHILCVHTSIHVGQLSAWRRAMGLVGKSE